MWRVVLPAYAALALAAPTLAETYVVNPEGTGDFPTIQAAIGAAADGDSILLAQGTYIRDGNRDIHVHDQVLTLMSVDNAPESCTIDCWGSADDPHRGFYFTSGVDSGFVLSGVTITHGYAPADLAGGPDGGGILCVTLSNPTIVNCHIIDCHADEAGGGISCLGGSSPSIRGCFLAQNTAFSGGGLRCSESSPQVVDCTFVENTSTYRGGGLYCTAESSPAITDCSFLGNHAGFRGGGVALRTGSPVLTRCTFADNVADDGDLGGGGAYAQTGAATLLECTFYGNRALRGSGLACHSPPVATVRNSIFAFGITGEAVACDELSEPVLTCCDIYGNEGGDWVGWIDDQYGDNGNISLDPLFCDPSNGDFALTEDSPCAPFTPPNEECDILGAWPVGCGPRVHEVRPDGSGDFPTIQAAIDASQDGDVVEMTDGVFCGAGNRDLDCLGKEITIRSRSGNPETCTINCEYVGRGFWFRSGEDANTVVEGITIAYGYGVNDGTGIRCDYASPRIHNCNIIGNSAPGDRGGGISCLECAPYISDCLIAENSAAYGGGIYCRESSPLIEGCTFLRNYAVQEGGGICCNWYSCPAIIGCTFHANDVVGVGGAVCCWYSSSPRLLNSILAFSVRGEGVGCLDGGSEPELICCDIFGNAGGDWVGCIASQLGVTGNICMDPLFCDPEEGDLTLAEDSPCAPFSSPNPACDLIGAWPVGCGPMGLPDHHPSEPRRPLLLAAPNPFMGSTHITFDVPGDASDPVRLSIHDLSGRRVCILDSAILATGLHGIVWDALDQCGNRVGSGIYFARLQVGEQSLIRRLTLLR